MLLAINDRIKGWLGIAVVALIGLPFALWGIESYVGGGKAQYAVMVDDTEVSSNQLDRDVSNIRKQIAQDKTRELPSDEELRKQALERIINTTILENETEQQGYEISDQVLAANIRRLFSRDGEFDTESYRLSLQSQGMNPSMFEEMYREELRVNQMRDAILASAFVSEKDVRRLVELSEQVRDISWLKLNLDKLAGEQQITDEDIQQYYDQNLQRFMQAATVSIEYVELSADTIKGIEISQADVQGRYDEYVAQQRQREERKARHILITPEDDDKAAAKNKIIEIAIKLNNGEDFSELAKQFSDDTASAEEGGDLDWVTLGQMVKPFEDALFELEKGQVSDVIGTEFGYHLIKLDDVRSAEIASFEDMQEELTAEVKQAAVDSMLYDLSEIMANSAYENPDSLEPVADALEQEIKTTAMFSRSSGSDVASRDIVREAAFSDAVLKQGENSELIELAPDHVLVLRVREHKESTPIPVADVREQIVASLRVLRGQEIVGKIADETIDKLKQGASIESVVRSGIDDMGSRKIDARTRDGYDRNFVRQVMSLPLPAEGKAEYGKLRLDSGDLAVVVINSVTFPNNIEATRLQATLAQFRQARAIEDFSVVMSALRDKAEIHINEKVIDRE